MTTRFKNAIDALVHAFFNDTLAKGNCCACAIGNICAASIGAKVIRNDRFQSFFETIRDGYPVDNYSWKKLFFTDAAGIQHITCRPGDHPYALSIVKKTRYSIKQLAKVEAAFESSTKIDFMYYGLHSKEAIMQDQYKGLMAVVDVLCEIEGIKDPAEYKQLFEIPAL